MRTRWHASCCLLYGRLSVRDHPGMGPLHKYSESTGILQEARADPHNNVIQALAANRTDQTFHIGILPRRSRSRDHVFDSHALYEGNDCSSENRISIPNQILRASHGNASRICCAVHSSRGRSVTLKCITRRRSCDKAMKTNSMRQVAVGTIKKSIEAICFM